MPLYKSTSGSRVAHASIKPRFFTEWPDTALPPPNRKVFLNCPPKGGKCSVSLRVLRQLSFSNLEFYFSLHLVSQHVGDKHSSQMASCFLKLSRSCGINGFPIENKLLQWWSNDFLPAKYKKASLSWTNVSLLTTQDVSFCPAPVNYRITPHHLIEWWEAGLPPWLPACDSRSLSLNFKVTHPIYVCAQCMCRAKGNSAVAPLERSNHSFWKTSSLEVHSDRKHPRHNWWGEISAVFTSWKELGNSLERVAGLLHWLSLCTDCRVYVRSKSLGHHNEGQLIALKFHVEQVPPWIFTYRFIEDGTVLSGLLSQS